MAVTVAAVEPGDFVACVADPGSPVHYEQMVRRGRRMRRVCAGTLVHYEQTVRDGDSASVCRYTGTL